MSLDILNNDFKILIVEDDPPTRFFTSTIVKSRYKNFFVAENGIEGLQSYVDNKPDIVISDISMPELDGLQMSRKIREINPEQQIIITTALDNKELLFEAIDIGINHYIIKPITKNQLIATLKRADYAVSIKNQLRKQYDLINKLSLALQESPTPVLILDDKGAIEYFNKQFSVLFQFKLNDVKGKNYSLAFPDSEFLDNLDLFFKLQSEKDGFQADIACDFPNKSKMWFSLFVFSVKNQDGNITNYVVELEDITQKELARRTLEETNVILENKVSERTAELIASNENLEQEIIVRLKAETELIKAKEYVEAANKAKDSFLAKVSHELRTPMNGIIGLTSILFGTELSQKQKKFLEMIKYSADNLLNIINDILDYSKLEEGKLKIKSEPFQLNSSIERVVELLKPNAQEKKLKLNYTINESCPKVLVGDKNRIEQTLINLVGNAIKFTNEGSIKVEIDVSDESDKYIELTFSVEDTGIGIADNQKGMLFKSFSQIEDTMTRKHGGTGLGLVISEELVKLMGGKIWFESEEGHGSIFSFSIPFEKKSSRSGQDLKEIDDYEIASEIVSRYPSLSLNILLAEDSIINQELVKQVFMQKQWLVTSVINGKEAVEVFRNGNFDIVLMDVQMPEMDGYEATKHIRNIQGELGKKTPIIALTAHNDDFHKQECLNAGMDDIIVKPLNWKEVFDTIYRVVKTEDNNVKNDEENEFIVADLSKLKEAVNNNTIFIKNIIDYFINNYKNEMNELEIAVGKKDYKRVQALAHKMKSECGNFGAQSSVELAKSIERTAVNGLSDQLIEFVYEFKQELAKLEIFLQKESRFL